MPSPDNTRSIIRTELEKIGLGPIGRAANTWKTCLYDSFDLLPAALQTNGVSVHWDLDGNGTEAVAFATTGGGITLSTGTTANNSCSLNPLSTSAWGVNRLADGSREHWLSTQIATPATITDTAILWGLKLTDTNGTAAPYKTDANQVLIVYDTDGIDIDPATGQADIAAGAANFYVVYSIGGSDYAIDTGVRVAASTDYKFDIRILTDGRAQVYINDVFIHTTPILTSANLKPAFCVYTRTTATRSMTPRWVRYLGR